MRRRRLRTAAVLLGAIALCGCSFQGSVSEGTSSSSSRSSSASPSTTSTAPAPTTAGGGATDTHAPEPNRCHTSELTGSLTAGDSGAGQRYATVVLRNTGGRTCTVHGYGGIQLAGADGTALPTQQVRVPDPPARLVTLAPGASASSALHWAAIPSAGDSQTGDCQPTAATLRVIPPDETDPLSIPWTQGPVCGGGRIEQKAYAG